MTIRRIGIFGGSFNPVHTGHVLMARAAMEEAQLDKVIFVPAAQSPFKPDFQLAPGPSRARLLRLALAGEPQFAVETRELEQGGISYSIDTVRWLMGSESGLDSGAEWHYLIGADHVGQLNRWRDSAELAERVQFLVIPRPGEAEVELHPPFRGRSLHGVPFAVSASMVRERVRTGKTIRGLVPLAVEEAILQMGLYSN